MKKVLVTTPTAPISNKISSHRAAQAVIYADQIASSGNYQVDINFGGKITDYSAWDIVAVYHGNDWGGTLNMFGGVKEYANIDSFVSLSNFTGEVWSLAIEFPKYSQMLKERLGKSDSAHPDWAKVNWHRLSEIESTATPVNPNSLCSQQDKIGIGDSHGISMYRTGWMVNSVPYKTLHGALSLGLESFILPERTYSEIEFYFGNIDIRHHLFRQDNPEEATKKLAREYVDQAKAVAKEYGAKVKLWEPLPIENPTRKLPKTGYYKGQPFYGSWAQRDQIRKVFIQALEEYCGGDVQLFKWTDPLLNNLGELDFRCMEKPQSVHLSREFYPHWQGKA